MTPSHEALALPEIVNNIFEQLYSGFILRNTHAACLVSRLWYWEGIRYLWKFAFAHDLEEIESLERRQMYANYVRCLFVHTEISSMSQILDKSLSLPNLDTCVFTHFHGMVHGIHRDLPPLHTDHYKSVLNDRRTPARLSLDLDLHQVPQLKNTFSSLTELNVMLSTTAYSTMKADSRQCHAALGSLSKLKSLYLMYNRAELVDNESISSLRKLKDLRHLKMFSDSYVFEQEVDDLSMSRLTGLMTQLDTLVLKVPVRRSQFTKDAIRSIGRNCRRLRWFLFPVTADQFDLVEESPDDERFFPHIRAIGCHADCGGRAEATKQLERQLKRYCPHLLGCFSVEHLGARQQYISYKSTTRRRKVVDYDFLDVLRHVFNLHQLKQGIYRAAERHSPHFLNSVSHIMDRDEFLYFAGYNSSRAAEKDGCHDEFCDCRGYEDWPYDSDYEEFDSDMEDWMMEDFLEYMIDGGVDVDHFPMHDFFH